MPVSARQATVKTIELLLLAAGAAAVAFGALYTWGGRDAAASVSHGALERRVDEHTTDEDEHFSREDAVRLERLDTRQEMLMEDVDELKGGVRELLRRTP